MAGGKRDKTVIWDLDGVIVDTSQLHFASWQQWAQELGRTFTEDDFFRLFGLRNSDIVMRFLESGVSADEAEALGEKKEELFRDIIRREKVTVLPGALELLRSLKEDDWRLALASSGPLESTDLILSSIGIGHIFECVVSARWLSQGKPAPDVFLLAASNLGVAPDCCVVIEDTIDGVNAAKAAGMKCISVTNTYPRERLTAADFIVDTLEAVGIRDIELLLK